MLSKQLKNYYNILDLDCFESNHNIIRNSYIKLTERFHPNIYSGDDLKERLIEINEAFLVLSDAVTKKAYDAALLTDGKCDKDVLLRDRIYAKHNKAEAFVASYFNGTQKKKISVWKTVGIILVVFFTVGTIGRIIVTCSRQNQICESDIYEPATSTATALPQFTPPDNWNNYKIDNALSIYVPPTLELRSEYDKYTKFMNEYCNVISNADAVFQQKDLGEMSCEALGSYCRIMVERYYVGADNAEHHTSSPQLTSDDYTELRSIADAEIVPWEYISFPSYEWIDINGTKGIDISYSRQGPNGEVVCHIYLLFNYDEVSKIVTAYRKVDEQIWSQDVNNVIKTFKWVHPK